MLGAEALSYSSGARAAVHVHAGDYAELCSGTTVVYD